MSPWSHAKVTGTKFLFARLLPKEQAFLQSADREGLPLGSWVRRRMLRAAERVLGREITPDEGGGVSPVAVVSASNPPVATSIRQI